MVFLVTIKLLAPGPLSTFDNYLTDPTIAFPKSKWGQIVSDDDVLLVLAIASPKSQLGQIGDDSDATRSGSSRNALEIFRMLWTI